MIRALTLAAALAVGIALPALAGDVAATGGPATQNLFTSAQARQHLMHLGYTDVSILAKDESGKWIGRATKDGKSFMVAVLVQGPAVTITPAQTN